MNNIKSINSLKQLHELLEKHDEKEKLIIFFDIDLTIVQDNEDEIDELIEPEVTKKLFDYILKHNIYFCFVTARFHDSVCNKRKRNLKEMKENVHESIFPILEDLKIDTRQYKKSDDYYVIKNERGRTVGILYKGIFFGSNKGEIIRCYRKENGFDKTHPHTIFIDDLETYLKSVLRHVPGALVLKREIS